MDILSRRQHGWVDIVVVVVFAAGPLSLGLEGAAAALSYVLAAVHLAMTILTQGLPVSVRPIIPMALHGLVEMAAGVLLALVAWLAFDGAARTFHLTIAAVVLAVFAVTSYQSER